MFSLNKILRSPKSPKYSPLGVSRRAGAVIFLALAAVIFFNDAARGIAREAAVRATSWAIAPMHFATGYWNRWGAGIYERAAAFKENAELKEIQPRLLADKAELLKLREENETLRRALGLRDETGRAASYAGVVGAFNEGRNEYLILNRGSEDGVAEGAAVLSPEGVLIGVVRTVSGAISTARLLASASEELTASILPSGINSIVRGDNSGEYIASLVPAESEVHAGDAVVSAGVNGEIPAGIPIGIVAAASRNSADSFQDVRIKSPVRILFLDRVIILIPRR